MELFTYFRSSAAYRVRIALNLKGLTHELVPVNLLKGEESKDDYTAVNPQGLVPALRLDDGTVLTQSPAILEYLDSTYREPRLLSDDPLTLARQRALCATIACEIHPLNNTRVLKALQADYGLSDAQKNHWYARWIQTSFEVIESQLSAAPFALGEEPSMMDVYLVPQVYNAMRFKVAMDAYPHIQSVYEHCNTLQAFKDAAPENQPDSTL